MPKLNSLEVVHQNTNKESFHELHDILKRMSGGKLGALLVKKSDDDFDIGWNTELLAQLADALAKYEYTLTVVADDKKALIEEIKKLSVEFGNANAQLIEELLVMASQNEALARKITRLNAELNGNSANVSQQFLAMVTEQEALAQLITDLDAEFSGNIATINSTLTTLANADSALASSVTSLTATVNSNTAAITSEATARATADSANASAIDTVEARLDTGDFAAVKTQSSTTASKVSGIEARWGVTTNVNGYVAGIQLLNGGSSQSSFTIAADKFIVRRPNNTVAISWNGSTSRLEIAGDVYADAFYGNVVNTGNVVANAITGSAVAYGTNPSISITTTGGRVIIQAFGTQRFPPDFGVTVSRSGAWTQNSLIGNGRFTFMYTETPSAGTYTYSINDGSEATLLIYELKR